MPNEVTTTKSGLNISPPAAGDSEAELESGMVDRRILGEDDDDGDKQPESDEDDEPESEPKRKEKTPDDDSGESEEEGEDESEDSDEDDEVEDESEEDESLETGGDANLFKSLRKAGILKKHPELSGIISNERKYAEVFSTPEDAQAALDRNQNFDAVYNAMISGDTKQVGNFLKALKNTTEEGLENFAYDILPAIGEFDSQLYGKVMRRPVQMALQSAYLDADEAGNKNLMAALLWTHKYFFGNTDIKTDVKTPKPEKREAKEDDKEKRYEARRLQDFHGDCEEASVHSAKNIIKKSLEGIDGVTKFTSRALVDDIFKQTVKVLFEDKAYLKSMDSMFMQAKSGGYSRDWKSRIISAYLGRFKRAFPAIKNKVLIEAELKPSNKKQGDIEPRRITPGRGESNREKEIDFSRVDKRRTTDMDILMDRPKYLKG